MINGRSLLIACVGRLIGFLVGYQWHAVPLSQVHAVGILQYEEPVHPAVTPTYPPGYFVVGRIYLNGGTAEMLGKRVVASGALTVQTHPETLSYPRIVGQGLANFHAATPPMSTRTKLPSHRLREG